MPSRRRRPRRQTPISPTTAVVALAFALGPWPRLSASASGPEPARTPAAAEVQVDPAPPRRPLLPRGSSQPGQGAARPSPEVAGGWWVGTAGVALALALCGWASVAARRYRPLARGGSGPTPLRVVGRASLSPRHTVYLLEVGGRVLIVGAGAQGAPSLLGELTDPDDLARLNPRGESAAPRFDRRPGGAS